MYNDTLKAKAVYEDLVLKEKTQIESIQNKDFKTFCKERTEFVGNRISNNEYIFDDIYFPKFNIILNEILVNNDSLIDGFVKVLIGRSLVPNAYCYGNGVLVLNLGLIKSLENENQLAFIIAHELSHQILEHSNRKIKKELEYVKSKERKSEVRKISSLESFEAFLLNRTLQTRKKSRINEISADSMAIKLLLKTKYNASEGIRALEILDQIDEEIIGDTINYWGSFNTHEFQFKMRWLDEGEGISVKQKISAWLIDSLKTHPDCKERIELIKNEFSLNKNDSSYNEAFNEFSKFVRFEIIRYELESKSFGFALSDALMLIQEFPDNAYLNSVISICLSELYFATKNHYLNDYIPSSNENFGFNYYRTHLLIENIRLIELKKMALSYYDSRINSEFNLIKEAYNEVLYAQYLNNKILDLENLEEFRNSYLEVYPNGFYTRKIKLNPIKK